MAPKRRRRQPIATIDLAAERAKFRKRLETQRLLDPRETEFIVGDAVLSMDGAAALAGVSRRWLHHEALEGRFDARWVGGTKGWVTTWSAVLEWARDREGSARRARGERPQQIAGTSAAMTKIHARKREERANGHDSGEDDERDEQPAGE